MNPDFSGVNVIRMTRVPKAEIAAINADLEWFDITPNRPPPADPHWTFEAAE